MVCAVLRVPIREAVVALGTMIISLDGSVDDEVWNSAGGESGCSKNRLKTPSPSYLQCHVMSPLQVTV